MKTQIIIASHKSAFIPSEASIYLPLQVGAEGKKPLQVLQDHPILDPSKSYSQSPHFERNNTGNHTSEKNPFYCELTGAYWAWKNLDTDLIGLVHYRRYFTVQSQSYRRTHAWQDSVLTEAELRSILSIYAESLYRESSLQKLLQNGLLIVPKKRKYYIDSL
jgi:hypothetical protein